MRAVLTCRWDTDFDNLVEFDPQNAESCPDHPHRVYSAPGTSIWEIFSSDLNRHQKYCAQAKLGVIYGVSAEERACLKRSHNACHTVLCWLTSTVARRYKADIFVDPPITSRIFHELNQGHMAFMEAHAVTCTPYPLPLAQMTNLVTLVFTMMLAPIQFAATIENPFWASGLSTFCTLLFLGVSECARELEDPFVGQPNDLPLSFLHAELNLGLIDLIKEPWPHRRSQGDTTAQKQARAEDVEDSRHHSVGRVGELRKSLTISDSLKMSDSEDSDDCGGNVQQEVQQQQLNQSGPAVHLPGPGGLCSLPGSIVDSPNDANACSAWHDNVSAGADTSQLPHIQHAFHAQFSEEAEEKLPPGVPRSVPRPLRAKYQRLSFRSAVTAVQVARHLSNHHIDLGHEDEHMTHRNES